MSNDRRKKSFSKPLPQFLLQGPKPHLKPLNIVAQFLCLITFACTSMFTHTHYSLNMVNLFSCESIVVENVRAGFRTRIK